MNSNDDIIKSKTTIFELPSPEANDLEPLAKALVALRRDEEPLAPSAELRRQVEGRLSEIESRSQGAVITKEQAMQKNSTGRFRLRDWVFFAGGSIAAAVATTIIFWPSPNAEVAKVEATHLKSEVLSQDTKDYSEVLASISRRNQSVVRSAGETAAESKDYSEVTSKMKKSMPESSPAGASTGAGGMPGMPGMGGGSGGGGNPGGPNSERFQGGAGGSGAMAGMPGGGLGKGQHSNGGPGGGKYPEAGGYQPDFEGAGPGLPASSGPDPYPPAALKIEPAAPAAADPIEIAVAESIELTVPAPQAAPKNDFMKSKGAITGTGLTGRGEAARGSMTARYGGTAPTKEEIDRYRMSLARQGHDRRTDDLAQLHEGEARGEAKGYDASLEDTRRLVSGEQYNTIVENQFLAPTVEPLSTFSIDVDTASYSNIRRFLTSGQMPPPAAVRIEEMVNYFGYSYAQPKGKEPFSVNMETADCPWNPGHVLLRVGLKGKEIERKARPASNLVFLLDVSGSMADENKLPLLKTTMTMLIGELTENDRVTIVTYAGDAGLKLEPTSGDQKEKITQTISSLSAGGSTNGSAGIELAYQKAAEAFIKEGTNRIILATDGDLNVGVTSDEALVKMIKEKAASGTFLTVLGFGEGNLKDGKLEQIADNGNGMYGYVHSVREGRKLMVEQLSGSLVTIAKDVKIQIEFNPAQIQSYRLLGYENRVMAAADFNNDKKDAGEIGAGHTVTALYELVPVEVNVKGKEPRPDVEPLKYQKAITAVVAEPKDLKALTDAATSGELLTLKLRYKEPDGVESRLIEFPLKEGGKQFNSASKDFQFAAAVASFGMILRGSQHRGSSNASAIAEIAAGALGEDANGLRAEFVDLVRRAEKLGIK